MHTGRFNRFRISVGIAIALLIPGTALASSDPSADATNNTSPPVEATTPPETVSPGAVPETTTDGTNNPGTVTPETTTPGTTTPGTNTPDTTTPGTTTPTTTTPSTPLIGSPGVPEVQTTDVGDQLAVIDAGLDEDAELCGVECVASESNAMMPSTAGCVAANCVPVAGTGVGARVGGGALPYTGISDVVAPLMLGGIVLLGGFIVMRWAKLRDRVKAMATRRALLTQTIENNNVSGYSEALRKAEIVNQAHKLFDRGKKLSA